MSEAAKEGADIIVFPEYGLTGVGVSNLVNDRAMARQFMVTGEVGRWEDQTETTYNYNMWFIWQELLSSELR